MPDLNLGNETVRGEIRDIMQFWIDKGVAGFRLDAAKEFYSGNIMAHGRVDNFDPEEKTKFTVVIWIEGSDPDCIDWLIGGEIKLEMVMEVVH